MNHKLIIIAIILAVLIGGIYFYGKNALQTTAPTYAVDPLNATYALAPNGGESVTFSNGIFSREAAPGSASKETIRIFGEPAMGDLNGDGKTDAAVFIQDETGGTGTFYFIAAALDTGNGTQGTGAIFLGDRIAPQNIQVSGGKITVNYADRAAGEPFSAKPTVGVSKYFAVQNGVLTEIK